MARGMWAIYRIAGERPDLEGYRDLASLLSQQLYNVSAAAWVIVNNASAYSILGSERELAQAAIADIDEIATARVAAMRHSYWRWQEVRHDYSSGRYADTLIGCIERHFGSTPDGSQEPSFARVVAARRIYGALLGASQDALGDLRAAHSVEESLPAAMHEWLQSRFARLGVGRQEQADMVQVMMGRLFPD
jgi:hypothetical protein